MSKARNSYQPDCANSSVRFVCAIMTFGLALTIPEHEEDLRDELVRPAFYAMILTNDLFSWDKERDAAERDGTCIFNAVQILMREHSITELEAKELCRATINKYAAESIRISEDTQRDLDISLDLRKYVEATQYTMSGNVVWSVYCPRYNPEASFNDGQYAMRKKMATCQVPTWTSIKG